MFLLVRMIQKKSNSISFHHCFYIFINMSKNTRVRQTHALNDEPVVIETFIVSARLSNATWRITDSNRWPPACKAGALASWANPPEVDNYELRILNFESKGNLHSYCNSPYPILNPGATRTIILMLPQFVILNPSLSSVVQRTEFSLPRNFGLYSKNRVLVTS